MFHHDPSKPLAANPAAARGNALRLERRAAQFSLPLLASRGSASGDTSLTVPRVQ
jgi:hypothetical protein